jgi:hypothetical protein
MRDLALADIGGRLAVVRRDGLYLATCSLACGVGLTPSSALADMCARTRSFR